MVVTTGCTQHPRLSHALSVTLLLSVKRMRCQWQICLFWSFPTSGPGLVPPEKAWPSHRDGAASSVRHMHISSLLEVISQHSSCSFSRKQAKPGGAAGTMAFYGPVCLSLCNGHSRAITHVLQTALGCCDHVLNTTSSRPGGDGPPRQATRNRRKQN